ncbi:MAG TPA: tetratricopeptide repeat protein [Bryobacteraceae bacterium]|jgi:tetratricopeptide (TPR) repeat protein|nr:tetratricopeptide repeat protein [Bryobacteraceae bacterium]
MSRWIIAAVFTAGVAAVSAQQTPAPPPPAGDQVQLPPEEDKSDAPKVYKFNPLQSKKEVEVGEYYSKKNDYRAAANRFLEATKWNDGNSDAWLRLAETQEKNHDSKAALAAYEKYLQLAPDSKNAGEVRKKIAKLKNSKN